MRKLIKYLLAFLMIPTMLLYGATNKVWVVTVPQGTDPNSFIGIRGGGGGDVYTSSNNTLTASNLFNGKVGVGAGATVAAYPLDVRTAIGGFMAVGDTLAGAGDYTGIRLGYLDNANLGLYTKGGIIFERRGANGIGSIHILNNTNNDSTSATLADAKLTIATNGFTGVGTTNPVEKLDVVGDINIPSGSSYRMANIRVFQHQLSPQNNIFVGAGSGNTTNTGLYDVGFGAGTLANLSTGKLNTAVGHAALFYNDGDQNTAIGFNSMFYNATGYCNTAVGTFSLNTNSNGLFNTAIGVQTMYYNKSGMWNTALGTYSLLWNNNNYNTAIGMKSLFANTNGSLNTAVGVNSLILSQGDGNTALGASAGYDNTNGNYNTFLGYNTGRGLLQGNYNTYIGANITTVSTQNDNIIIADGEGHQRINVDSTGMVGINTNTPAATLDVNGDMIVRIPDYTVAYLGYPKLALVTNMVSSSTSAGTPITLVSFTNAFDNSFVTTTTTGSLTASQLHSYQINLATNYTGMISVSIVSINTAGSINFYVCEGGQDAVLSGGSAVGLIQLLVAGTSGVGSKTNLFVAPFAGSKMFFLATAGSSGAGSYWIRDLSIYGVTNGYNGFAGAPLQ